MNEPRGDAGQWDPEWGLVAGGAIFSLVFGVIYLPFLAHIAGGPAAHGWTFFNWAFHAVRALTSISASWPHDVVRVVELATLGGGLAGVAGGYWVARPVGGNGGAIYVSGPRLWDKLPTQRDDPGGLQLHPAGLAISLWQEVRHFIIFGQPGGGKTTILWRWILQWAHRGTKLLIFDIKGDFAAGMPGDVAILSPWDKRALRWNLGRDIGSVEEVDAFVAKVCPVPTTGDPVWARAAGAVLKACIIECMHQSPGRWFLADVRRVLLAANDITTLQDLIRRRVPEAFQIVADAKSKATTSVLFQLSATLQSLLTLGQLDEKLAERDKLAGKPRVTSLRDCLDHKGRVSPLLFPAHPAGAVLTETFVGAAFEIAGMILLARPDCPPDQNQVALICDEFPQLGRMPVVRRLMELGRSKSVRIVLGFQFPAQVRDVWGDDALQILTGSASIKIVTQLSEGGSGDLAKDLIGEAVWKIRHETSSIASGGQGGANRSAQWARETHPLMTRHDLECLGPISGRNGKPTGIRAVVVGYGPDRYRLDWPLYHVQQFRPGLQLLDLRVPPPPAPSGGTGGGGGGPTPPAPSAGGSRVQAQQQHGRRLAPAPMRHAGDQEQDLPQSAAVPPPRLTVAEIAAPARPEPAPSVDAPVADAADDLGKDRLAEVADAAMPGLGTALHLVDTAIDTQEAVANPAPAEAQPAIAPSPDHADQMESRKRKWRRREPEQDREPD